MPSFEIRYGPSPPLGPAVEHLLREGPCPPVAVSVPPALSKYLTDKGEPVPEPKHGLALIDTGASISGVDNGIIEALGVKPVGSVKLVSAKGGALHLLYPATFSFPGTPLPGINFERVAGVELQEPQASDTQVKGPPLIAIIGRDVLRQCLLIYNGYLGYITLSF